MEQAARIISIANQKGGVGKTTTAINLATAMAAVGKHILLVDLDPQGNASTGVGIEIKDRKRNIYKSLIGQYDIRDCILHTEIPQLDIIAATTDLAAISIELGNESDKEKILKGNLSIISSQYDYIIIDCAPSLGLLTINALAASYSVMIPLQCEFFAMEGLVHLLNTVSMVRDALNPQLDIEGIVLTMADKRNNLSINVEDEVRQELGNLVYETVIPRNVKLSEAPSFGKPAIVYDTKCLGSVAYIMLAKEIIKKG